MKNWDYIRSHNLLHIDHLYWDIVLIMFTSCTNTNFDKITNKFMVFDKQKNILCFNCGDDSNIQYYDLPTVNNVDLKLKLCLSCKESLFRCTNFPLAGSHFWSCCQNLIFLNENSGDDICFDCKSNIDVRNCYFPWQLRRRIKYGGGAIGYTSLQVSLCDICFKLNSKHFSCVSGWDWWDSVDFLAGCDNEKYGKKINKKRLYLYNFLLDFLLLPNEIIWKISCSVYY